jgi:hypothetical protein
MEEATTMKTVRKYVVRDENYAPSRDMAPLTREQKASLSMLARKAWRRLGRGENENAWRHAQAIKAVGRRISEGVQRDFLPLRAHFLDLAGHTGAALDTLLAAESEKHRIALFKLGQACSQRGLPLSYPEAICKRQYRCSLAEATAPQIWRLFFTVRNRRQETRRKPTR